MKHFDQISLVKLQIDLPDFTSKVIVPNSDDCSMADDSVADAVWHIMERKIRKTPDGCCAINDITCGFDFASVSVELFNWDTAEELEYTMGWINKVVEDALAEICKANNIKQEAT